MIEEVLDVFMDDFLVYEDSFTECLENLERVLEKCEETNFVLEFDTMKIEVIEKLPPRLFFVEFRILGACWVLLTLHQGFFAHI
ncbi:reverse transcriptase [Gossypium australe]|uniref:Reverse transcriptase n=1 Tax=Gossypium australe TaxID=47621 RepID=A0A5B6V075_9ROSI|nr:reverse transcriptase [Gossypium australe]